MPFFGSSKRSSSSTRQPTSESSRESYLSPPPVFSDDDVFGNDYKSSVYYDPPSPSKEGKKELNSGAKRLLNRSRAGKENGLKKLIRRHSHKLSREIRDPSPEDLPPPPYSPAKLRNGRQNHSLDSYHGADNMLGSAEVRHQPAGPKGVHFAEQEAKLDYYNRSEKIKKPSKLLKKSKSVHQKMPLPSVLKPPSSASSGCATRSDEDRLSHSSDEYFSHRHPAHIQHVHQQDRQRQFYADYHGEILCAKGFLRLGISPPLFCIL